ncbi:tripartite tricarboxylate transporter substrate binding protein [Piscinibacter sakaiensis]|uniref:Putative exported protein n=1 Tax=Piscinibacter sakaiensis TaxID=1547922 RepID=A0A0K8NTT0_PISS1|nr:tripartite tricarboxylate transporter substrate binding protein [Piscinibacter sakaiensis]GAP33659.1 putative exported protein [Piscinibacter sakaiensis]
MKRRSLVTATLSLTLVPWTARADRPWPGKPIRLICPYPPGGIADALSRLVAQILEKDLGQTIVIENRGGAGSNLGSDVVAKSPPDGYTLLMGSSANAANVSLYPKLPYDPVKDFVPVSLLAEVPNVLVVNAQAPYSTVRELIAAAKAQPGQLTYASSGAGSPAHLAAEEFARLAGIRLRHIPYKGAGPAITDVMAGHLPLMFTNYAAVAGGVQSGKLRLLGVGTAERMGELPTSPTIAESGVPGYQFSAWYGLLAPAGTPSTVVDRLQAALAKAREPAAEDAMRKLGVTPVTSTPAVLRSRLDGEVRRYAQLIKAAGITLE